MAAFLLEVGTEELPAAFVAQAIAQWQDQIPQSLADHYLQPETLRVYGTPRRLAVVIEGLPECQADREEEIKGPPVAAAFKDGEPTPAAQGFARKQGVELSDFQVRPTDKGDFVFVTKRIAGRGTAEILQELIPGWITGLEGKRLMRWGDGDLRFSRPIRWLVTLLDHGVLPIRIDNGSDVIESDRYSRGHRVLHPELVNITSALDYPRQLEQAFVLVDPAERDRRIREQTLATATALGGEADMPEDLVTEVRDLTEWPTAVLGSFEERFLSLPAEVITMVMISHQRYFPIYRTASDLDPAATATATEATSILFPNFITISNGDPAKAEVIAAGNARVVRARLADGEFFYKSDCTHSLETLLPKLETVTFQEKLGSVRAKVDRIGAIAAQIALQLDLGAGDRTRVERAALLCKADLVSQMVFEFPELQGVMGQKYALVGGEDPAVAAAIAEHYLPKGAGDALPQTLVGQVVGLADRLDTLVSIFGIGQIPSGSSDPFALRRAANAVVNIIWQAELPLNVDQLLQEAIAQFAATFPDLGVEPAALQEVFRDFFVQRLRTLLQEEQGIDYDLVNAVLGENDAEYRLRALQNLRDTSDRAQFLQTIRRDGRLDSIYEIVNRSTRLAAQGNLNQEVLDPQGLVDAKLFQQPTEAALLEGLVALVPQTEAAKAERDYGKVVEGLAAIAPVVREFFDGEESVLVMAEDLAVRRNRLNLLGVLRNHGRVLADFGAIVKGA